MGKDKLGEGVYVPLSLTTTLVVSGATTTLEGAISQFVTAQAYDQPGYRREYAASLAEAIQAEPRQLLRRVYLPLVLK